MGVLCKQYYYKVIVLQQAAEETDLCNGDDGDHKSVTCQLKEV